VTCALIKRARFFCGEFLVLIFVLFPRRRYRLSARFTSSSREKNGALAAGDDVFCGFVFFVDAFCRRYYYLWSLFATSSSSSLAAVLFFPEEEEEEDIT
jgi:hypothetical protein